MATKQEFLDALEEIKKAGLGEGYPNPNYIEISDYRKIRRILLPFIKKSTGQLNKSATKFALEEGLLLEHIFLFNMLDAETARENGSLIDRKYRSDANKFPSIVCIDLAKNGYCLETLIDNDNHYVRAAVAERGYGLERLMYDDSGYVRQMVVKNDYGIDYLKDDPEASVRYAVAKMGHDLDNLIEDDAPSVRGAALSAADEKPGFKWENYTKSKHEDVRAAVAKHGKSLDILYNDPSEKVRIEVVKQGAHLKELVKDKSPWVRAAVVEQGYGIDILANDDSVQVRNALLKQGHGLEESLNSKSADIRASVAEQGYGLDKLVNDKAVTVRVAVAQQGYGLDKLIDDDSSSVIDWAVRYIDNMDDFNFDEINRNHSAVATAIRLVDLSMRMKIYRPDPDQLAFLEEVFMDDDLANQVRIKFEKIDILNRRDNINKSLMDLLTKYSII